MTNATKQAFFVEPVDGEVIGVEKSGALIQWDAATQEPYTSGETLAEFGIENLSAPEVVLVNLIQAGWVMDARDRTAFTKDFDSAAGVKTAIANLREGADSYRLEGLYYSEGRNILSTSSVFFPKTASTAQVAEHAAKFLADCEKEIGQSYAVRLLRNRDA